MKLWSFAIGGEILFTILSFKLQKIHQERFKGDIPITPETSMEEFFRMGDRGKYLNEFKVWLERRFSIERPDEFSYWKDVGALMDFLKNKIKDIDITNEEMVYYNESKIRDLIW